MTVFVLSLVVALAAVMLVMARSHRLPIAELDELLAAVDLELDRPAVRSVAA